MPRHELSDNVVPARGTTLPEVVERLGQLKPGESWEIPFDSHGLSSNTDEMSEYVSRLQQLGLDIGIGKTEFGYRTPIPERGESQRYLEVYKR